MTTDDFWKNKRVFLTGHTGFKGTWLVHMLTSKGAIVAGYSLAPETTPNMFDLTRTEEKLAAHDLGDIRDANNLAKCMASFAPDVSIHMAAQPLVRRSYSNPVETWSTNVMGTVNFLEAVRACPSLIASLVVTTDKCYENNSWHWGYRETDALGGFDPYSASKAGSELVVQSYRQSFFAKGVLLASARAGNVIGGGDWSQDRLIPDAVRAVHAGKDLEIRSPEATRPWQHVIDCLEGYLILVRHLLENKRDRATNFNFGPDVTANITVKEILTRLKAEWADIRWNYNAEAAAKSPHEASFLYLDSSKARSLLGWSPRWNIGMSLKATADWYRVVGDDPKVADEITRQQIETFYTD